MAMLSVMTCSQKYKLGMQINANTNHTSCRLGENADGAELASEKKVLTINGPTARPIACNVSELPFVHLRQY